MFGLRGSRAKERFYDRKAQLAKSWNSSHDISNEQLIAFFTIGIVLVCGLQASRDNNGNLHFIDMITFHKPNS